MEKNLIYIVCARLEKKDGTYEYDPAIDPAVTDAVRMLACDDLVSLQNENEQAIEALREIADVVIVPVSLSTYRELEDELNRLLTSVDTKITEAVEKMAEAYAVMGLLVEKDEMEKQMKEQALGCGKAGKVLNEALEIVDRSNDYVEYNQDDDYDECDGCDCDEEEEDDGDEDEDEDYDEEDYGEYSD